jgi:putative membrane protein
MQKLSKLTSIGVISAVAAFAGSARPLHAADNDTGKTKTEERGQFSAKDYKFVREAAEGGLLEVKLGELAKQKGTSQSVQQFGDRMVTDHTKANNDLKQIVSQKGAMLPDQLSRKEEHELMHFQKLSGKDFDKNYAEHMVKDHNKDIKEFQDAAKNAQDPELKAFAQKTLPVLEQHMQQAQQIESSLKEATP